MNQETQNPTASPEKSSSQPTTNPVPAKKQTPRALITQGCRTNSLADVAQGIAALTPDDGFVHPELLSWSLARAVYHGQPDIMLYLLRQLDAPITSLTPSQVGVAPTQTSIAQSITVFQILLDHGWDINQHDPAISSARPGQCLLQLVCAHEPLVHWCLDHGASVTEDLNPDPFRNPPLLEIAAQVGTVATFRLLHARGAQLGRRTLHSAVESAAWCPPDARAARMTMVRYLVDELGLDVNAVDTVEKMPNHWGSPLCYAAHTGADAREVGVFLLERGADPLVRDCWDGFDAFGLAERIGNKGFLEMLREWEVKKGKV